MNPDLQTETQSRGCVQRLVRRPAKDRKDKLEMVVAQAEKMDGTEAIQAWRRLCRELGHMTHPEAPMPRFNGLLNALWIAASNDQT